jgi:hypothetical protein
MPEPTIRRVRAVLRTAFTWSAAWGAVGGALSAAAALFDRDPRIDSLLERLGLAAMAGVAWGVRFALVGAVIGAVFAVAIRVGYRGRRLADISPLRFALLGAVVGGVGVPLFLQTMNVLTGGGPIAWGLVTDDGVWAAIFGAAAAAGSILLARRADARGPAERPDELDRADDLDALPAPAPHETPLRERSRVARS